MIDTKKNPAARAVWNEVHEVVAHVKCWWRMYVRSGGMCEVWNSQSSVLHRSPKILIDNTCRGSSLRVKSQKLTTYKRRSIRDRKEYHCGRDHERSDGDGNIRRFTRTTASRFDS